MNLVKHSRKNNYKNFLLAFILFTLTACNKEERNTKFLAKVDDSYLTEENYIEIKENSSFSVSKEEFIKNWIERELLYQEALNLNLDKNQDFKKSSDESLKLLLNAFLIKKIIEETEISISSEELESFYNVHKDEFTLTHKNYLVNLIRFNDEDKAIQFRNILIESDWQKTLNVFSLDESILSIETEKLFSLNNLSHWKLQTVVVQLEENEVSIILKVSEGNFIIVQLVKVFNEREIPEFKYIKEIVSDNYIIYKKNEIYRNFINELSKKYEVEIPKNN